MQGNLLHQIIWSRIYRVKQWVKVMFTDPAWNCRQKLSYNYEQAHLQLWASIFTHSSRWKWLHMAYTTLYFQIWSSLSMIEGYHIQIRDMSIDNSEKVNGFDVVTIAGGATRWFSMIDDICWTLIDFLWPFQEPHSLRSETKHKVLDLHASLSQEDQGNTVKHGHSSHTRRW